MSKEYPTASPRPLHYEYRRVPGESQMIEFKVCGKWFRVTRAWFNKHFERDQMRPNGQGQ